ncbi:redox-regulated ATPase YchF [bacterium]|nr:redox-regulated ATPase YchF [bacterium]MBU1599695.1 redox-regulated ATPase YchF [bacterium]MBU2461715.1 redox-regulated ATPase YchF [bacterium]
MKLAIIGLSNSGKTTIFNALTGQLLETTTYPTQGGEPNFGIVKVPNERVDRLSEIYKPKKSTYATIEYIDYLGITKGDALQNRKVFNLIKDVDAIVHCVRAFTDESVPHPLNEVNPFRDIDALEFELIFEDLEFIEKRLERMAEGAKRGKNPNDAEKELLLKCKDSLTKEIPLRKISFNDQEQKVIKPLQFISIKPEVILLNIGEEDLNTDREQGLLTGARKYFKEKYKDSQSLPCLTLCGKIEMDIAQLSIDEAKAFLDDLRIEEPALNRLINLSYDLLSFVSFLTVGEDEVRAWTITKGTDAVKSASKIHSDIERGFIRAEVIGFDDFILAKTMVVAKDKGLLRLEGKTYQVRDGDIINFRFNV